MWTRAPDAHKSSVVTKKIGKEIDTHVKSAESFVGLCQKNNKNDKNNEREHDNNSNHDNDHDPDHDHNSNSSLDMLFYGELFVAALGAGVIVKHGW